MRKLIFTNLMLLMIILLPSTALAAVTDAASLLSGAELSKLNSKIQEVEHKYGITINIVTQPTLNGKNIVDVSKALIERITDSQNSGVNGNIVLLVDMDKRRFQAETDRKLKPLLFDSQNNPRFDESGFIAGFKKGDYFSGFSAYIDQLDMALAKNQSSDYDSPVPSPYAETENQDAGLFDPMAALIAVVGGIAIGVMYRSSLIASMSNVRPALEASEYLDKNNVKITERRDTFLYMNVSRQPKSRGSGHGGGGGGNSGGGHGGSF